MGDVQIPRYFSYLILSQQIDPDIETAADSRGLIREIAEFSDVRYNDYYSIIVRSSYATRKFRSDPIYTIYIVCVPVSI